MSTTLETSNFIDKVTEIHGGYYSYPNLVYGGNKEKVAIVCPIHGEFWQRADHHSNGHGCSKCRDELNRDIHLSRGEAAFNAYTRLPKNHNYDYSASVYGGAHKKIKITCKTHGEFWQSPNSHTSGHGCPKCGVEDNIINSRAFHKSQRPDLSHIGTPEGSKAVPVGTKGDYALVDEEDYEKVMEHNWRMSHGYAVSIIEGKGTSMHRFVEGVEDENVEVDHINHNTLDNRKSQLRQTNRVGNAGNSRPHSDSKWSNYKGVTFDKHRGKFLSKIMHNRLSHHVGYFTDEIEAARAYDRKAVELKGEFAYLNFPEEKVK